MPKLTMLKGLPAGGKTTRAKEIVASGDWVRVNRDLLREMLHNNKWSGRNEDLTVDAEKSLAFVALTSGRSVVVDDCNLNPKNEVMWRDFAKDMATFEVEEVQTPMEECIKRDEGREKAVGRHVIANMALQYDLYPKSDKGLVLCDLDGTLCAIDHRLKYAKGPDKDWGKFFAGIPDDVIRLEVAEMLSEYRANGHKIVLVSARPETYRKETEAWLYKNGLEYGVEFETLIMRPAHDKRDDTEVKQQIYDKHFKDKYPIEAVIDDRPKVIRMWRSNGLEVVDVGQGIEF